MLPRQNSKASTLAAIACLLAVLLLQAPFASAVWLYTSTCCMGDHCPIPSHHHKAATDNSEMPMDCGHHSAKMADCKISCCNSTDDTAINIAQFVIPAPQSVAMIQSAVLANNSPAPQQLSRFEKPQSPPPRTIPS